MPKLTPKALINLYAENEINPSCQPRPLGEIVSGGQTGVSYDPEILLANQDKGISGSGFSPQGSYILPPAPDEAAWKYAMSRHVKAMKETLAEYCPTQPYFIGSLVKGVGNIMWYSSKIDNNIGNPLTDTTKWDAYDITRVNDATTSRVGTVQMAFGSTTNIVPDDNLVNTALNLKAPLLSPALTGTPTAPTQATSDNSTKIATTAFVKKNKGNLNSQFVFTANFDVTPEMAGSIIYINEGTCETIAFPENASSFQTGDIIYIQSKATQNIRLRRGTLADLKPDILSNDFGNKLPAFWSVALITNSSPVGGFWDVLIPPSPDNGAFILPASPSTTDNSNKIATTAFVKNNYRCWAYSDISNVGNLNGIVTITLLYRELSVRTMVNTDVVNGNISFPIEAGIFTQTPQFGMVTLITDSNSFINIWTSYRPDLSSPTQIVITVNENSGLVQSVRFAITVRQEYR